MSYHGSKKQKRTRPQKSNTDTPTLIGIFISSFKAAVLAFIASVILLLIICAAVLNTSDPLSLTDKLSLAALYIPSFLAGFLCVKFKGDSAFVCGALSGGIFMLLYKFFALFIPQDHATDRTMIISVTLHLLIFVFSISGAYISRSLVLSRKPRHKKR